MFRITCPNCDHKFATTFDSEGHCECPNCGITLSTGVGLLAGYNYVTEFEECVSEAWVVLEDLHNMDDESLEEEISTEVAANDYMRGTFGIFTEMEINGELSEDMRKMAEGVYLLMHTRNYFGHEQ